MVNIRLQYQKTGHLKFLGHLDLMRTFYRAFKRARLPVSYSQGFNPHMLLSIGLPLSVGVSSVGELMDVELEERLPEAQVIHMLNDALPSNIHISKAMYTENKNDKAASAIEKAKYEVEAMLASPLPEDFAQKVKELLSREEWMIEKKSKKGMKLTNIRDYVFDLCVEVGSGLDRSHENTVNFTMCVSAGSTVNVKADLVIDYIKAQIEGFCVDELKICRMALLDAEGKGLII